MYKKVYKINIVSILEFVFILAVTQEAVSSNYEPVIWTFPSVIRNSEKTLIRIFRRSRTDRRDGSLRELYLPIVMKHFYSFTN